MAKADFEGKALAQDISIPDGIYVVSCTQVDDEAKTMAPVGEKAKPKTKLIVRWKLDDGKELSSWFNVDVAKGSSPSYSTSSYLFLEKVGKLEAYKAMCNGRAEVANEEVIKFFKTQIVGMKCRILTKTVLNKTTSTPKTVIDRFVEVVK